MVFSTNQNRQFYVVDSVKDASSSTAKEAAALVTAAGDLAVIADKEGAKHGLYYGMGGKIKTDMIYPKTIMWATKTAPEDLAQKLKSVRVEITKDSLISGQDYILRINLRQYLGMSDEDIYQKYGAVHCTAAMANETKPYEFVKEMVYSLFKNFSRETGKTLYFVAGDEKVTKATKVNGLVHLYYIESADGPNKGKEVEITYTDMSPANGKCVFGIYEEDPSGDWALGTKQITRTQFDVVPVPVQDADGNDVFWGGDLGPGQSTKFKDLTISGSYTLADLEYFCMGERGDQYRMVGWPKVIPTKYMINTATDYYVLDIHYAYRGTCEDFQKSEKTITFVADDAEKIDSIAEYFGVDAIATGSDHWPSDDNTEGDEGDENP